MPTKTLPDNPSLDHLKYQAKDLLKGHREANPEVLQRIREFHPRFRGLEDVAIAQAKLTLTDAYYAIAREYGFPSWTRLRTHIAKQDQAKLKLPFHERIEDPIFRQAVDLLDVGDADGLRRHLAAHPRLVRQKVAFEGGNYFQNPGLLEFVAENPIRHGRLPKNIVEIAHVILDAGAKEDRRALTETLGLVASGMVPREMGVQGQLIDLLCRYGAEVDGAMVSALAHGEFDAVEALRRNGAKADLKVAATTGDLLLARRTLSEATPESRHIALAFASTFGYADIVRLLIEAGEDPNRYNPPGAHSHSTPAHQAALAGHLDVLKALVEGGADLKMRDILFHGMPLDWAVYGKQAKAEEYLRSVESST